MPNRDDVPVNLVWIPGGSALGNIRLSLLAPKVPDQYVTTEALIAAPPKAREGAGYVGKSKTWLREPASTAGVNGAGSRTVDHLAVTSPSADDRTVRSMSRMSGPADWFGPAPPAPPVNASKAPRKSGGQRPTGLLVEDCCT
jgi:hypothetical protein